MDNTPLRKRIAAVFSLFFILFVLSTSIFGTVSHADTDAVTTDAAQIEVTGEATDDKTAAPETDAAEKAESEAADTATDTTAADTETDDTAKAEDTSASEKKEEFQNKYTSKGIFATISIPFGYIVWAVYKIIPDYGVALLVYAIVMKLVLFPFGIKQQKNSLKQARLRPKEMAVRKKYAGRNDKPTQQKMQQEIMDLYQRENFNPMGGCLPLLLQFPILLALYQVVYNPIRHISHIAVDTISELAQKVVDLGMGSVVRGDIDIVSAFTKASPEMQAKFLEGTGVDKSAFVPIKMFGVDLSGTPGFSDAGIKLIWIPIITFITVYFSMKLTKKMTYQPIQNGDAKSSGIIMDLVMPLMSTWFTFLFPGMLGVYWIFQNLLGILQQFVLMKMYPLPKFTDEDYAKAEREMAGKEQKKKKNSAVSGKRHPKSLHHIDDDDDELPSASSTKNDSGVQRKKQPEVQGIVPPAPLKEDISHDKTDKKDK